MQLDEGVLRDLLSELMVMDDEPQGAHESRIGRRIDLPELDVTLHAPRRAIHDVGVRFTTTAQARHVTHHDRIGLESSPVSPPTPTVRRCAKPLPDVSSSRPTPTPRLLVWPAPGHLQASEVSRR